MQLSIPQNAFQLSPTGLQIRADLTKEQSIELFRFLQTLDGAMEFALGDWQKHHEQHWGKDSLDEVLQQSEFDYVRSMRARRIADIPHEARTQGLSAKHHHTVAKGATSTEEQQRWLALASEHRLSNTELARSIRAGKLVTKAQLKIECPSNAGFESFEAIRVQFDRLTKQFQDDPPTQWPAEDRERILAELAPIVALAVSLRASLEFDTTPRGRNLLP